MGRSVGAARYAAFVFLSSLVMVMASERVYWYLDGISVDSTLTITVFYVIPTTVALWVLGRSPSGSVWWVVPAGAVYAFVVEGVLTPVLYEDGALPVLASLFVGWHGLLGVVCFWYLARRLLLQRRIATLSLGAAVIGVYWGVWSITWLIPGASADFEDPFTTMGPSQFLVYALVVGAILATGHWLLGWVWPASFVPGRVGTVVIVVVTSVYAGIAVLPAVWWAPVKFAALVGVALWVLRRSRRRAPHAASIVTSLQGRVRATDTLAIMVMPVVASAVYAALWEIAPSDAALEALYEAMNLTQVAAGAAALAWAARRTFGTGRPREASAAPPSTTP